MHPSPLLDLYRDRQLATADYRGALTASGGGDGARLLPDWPPTQVLLYDACWRAALQVEGPEARKWLNGMITANVRDLRPGHAAPSFQLDPKGHILATLDVVCLAEDRFLLITERDQLPELRERLRRFVFVSKLTIADRDDTALILRGPAWHEVWPAAPVLAAGEAAAVERAGAHGDVIASAPGGVPQVEVLAPPQAIAALWQELEPRALAAGSKVFERDRILSRVPRYGADVTDAELPQETGQLDRLDFTKGCYIGQEIVERIRARGAVRRHWTSFALPASAAPGATVVAEEKELGKLTSIARRERHGNADWLGLGYIRDPHQAPGTAVTVGDVAGQVEAV
jgi:folate-binding protein YgfZ